MKAKIVRSLYLIFGSMFVVLGVIGILLPLLPTTPFLLVATFCFSRSSERLHQAILNNKYVGKYIRDWEEGGVIALKAKILATTMMCVMVSYPLLFKSFHVGLKMSVISIVLLTMIYIWSRPSELKKAE